MKINLQGKGIELTEAIKDYVHKKVLSLEKFTRNEDTEDLIVDVEIGKTTNHHKKGEFLKAEINLLFAGKKFYAISEKEDLYVALDSARTDMERQIVASKKRESTLFRRGARSVKKMMKGLSKRNPFTSKY